jgi:Spy/CpxP family protein refolding chaperone
MTDTIEPTRPLRQGRSRRGFVAAIVLAATAGGIATAAVSQGFGGHWHGPGMMGGPFMGPMGRGFGAFDPAQAEEHATRMVRHLAIEVDATKEQEEKLVAIARQLVKDAAPLREKLVSSRTVWRDLLVADKVDRAALEKQRADQMANADALTKRFLQAVSDTADVLTPEQRRKIADRLLPPGDWSRGSRRG